MLSVREERQGRLMAGQTLPTVVDVMERKPIDCTTNVSPARGMMRGMKMNSEELARRLSEADRMVVLLRKATLEMQAVRDHLVAERRRELQRSGRDRAPRR